jgi:hypothetical protein
MYDVVLDKQMRLILAHLSIRNCNNGNKGPGHKMGYNLVPA